jgi:hypothetical protein
MDGVSSELALDLRRLRNARLILFAVVCDPDEPSESEELELLDDEDELEVSRMSARSPGCDSSSIRSCGILSYMYA